MVISKTGVENTKTSSSRSYFVSVNSGLSCSCILFWNVSAEILRALLPSVFTRVSGTRCGAHCSPCLTNWTPVCQKPSERAHPPCAPVALLARHARTDAQDPRGKERAGELVHIYLPTSLCASARVFVCLLLHDRILSVLSLLSRTKETQLKDHTGVCNKNLRDWVRQEEREEKKWINGVIPSICPRLSSALYFLDLLMDSFFQVKRFIITLRSMRFGEIGHLGV